MDRIFDQEMKFSIKPSENNKQFFMQNDESIKNKIIKLLKDEFKDDIEISSQMKFGIEYFTEKFLNNENFTFVKYGDGELLCMLGAKNILQTNPVYWLDFHLAAIFVLQQQKKLSL